MSPLSEIGERLAIVVDAMPSLVVAVSGGVDSLALMQFIHKRREGRDVEAVHAVSPAVPPASTERVRELARVHGWRLRIVDAGETSDPAYLANPVDRCRVCKSHLYDSLSAIARSSTNRELDATRATNATNATSATSATDAIVVSGTNFDDLDDYRPGLQAAKERGVRHPFVEARITKDGVRSLAREVGLGDEIAALPAQPCLSSRVETGIRIDAAMLRMIDDVENGARARLGPNVTVRCRVRAQGLVLEIDDNVLRALDDAGRESLIALAPNANASLAPYRMGSAFLRVL